jgi:metal-responsive CopG/Arc/MetJ family transcriptional regulator
MRTTNDPKPNRITFRLNDEMLQEVERFAEEYHMKPSRVVRLAIQFYLKCNKEGISERKKS